MAERKPTETRRREIADAALRVIARHGLGRFTTQAISREVGLTDGALFRHFGTKEDIVDAAIDRAEQLLFTEPTADAADPLARLGEFFRERLVCLFEHPGVARIVYSDELAQAAGVKGEERVRELKQRSHAFVKQCLIVARRAKLLREPDAIEEQTMIVLGSLVALALLGPMVAPSDSPRARAERQWRLLERLLRAPEALKRAPRAGRGLVGS